MTDREKCVTIYFERQVLSIMQEKIYTIPIHEAYESPCGCPLCTLALKLESDALDYVMGAAMMEPDVRIATNRAGFCRAHLTKMLSMKNRLGLSLILQTHLQETREKLPSKGLFGNLDCSKALAKLDKLGHECFVCSRVGEFFDHICENLVYMWEKDLSFRQRFAEAESLCLPHAEKLLQYGSKRLPKKLSSEFAIAVCQQVGKSLEARQAEIDAFCKSFEYQNSGNAMTEEQKHGAERTANALRGRDA